MCFVFKERYFPKSKLFLYVYKKISTQVQNMKKTMKEHSKIGFCFFGFPLKKLFFNRQFHSSKISFHRIESQTKTKIINKNNSFFFRSFSKNHQFFAWNKIQKNDYFQQFHIFYHELPEISEIH